MGCTGGGFPKRSSLPGLHIPSCAADPRLDWSVPLPTLPPPGEIGVGRGVGESMLTEWIPQTFLPPLCSDVTAPHLGAGWELQAQPKAHTCRSEMPPRFPQPEVLVGLGGPGAFDKLSASPVGITASAPPARLCSPALSVMVPAVTHP